MAKSDEQVGETVRRVLKGKAIQDAPDPKPALKKILKKAKGG